MIDMIKKRLILVIAIILAVSSTAGCGEFYFHVIDGSAVTLTDVIDKDRPPSTPKPTKEPKATSMPAPATEPMPGSEGETSGSVVDEAYAVDDSWLEPGSAPKVGFLSQPAVSFDVYRENVQARGLYLTANTAGIEESLMSRVDFAGEYGLNSLVIDVKDEKGYVTFKNKIAIADELGASINYIADVDKLLGTLKENGIYTIARVVVFKDNVIADERPDFIIRLNDGSLYWENDSKGEPQFCWLNPYNRDVWEYVVDIAVETAKLGFDEIQFDYIRFPTDANIKNADFGDTGGLSYTEIIEEFSRYAMGRLKPYGVKVSADVFATVIISELDASLIGQDFVALARIFDILCPMIYPSHFAVNTMGIANPDSNPYDTLNKTFKLMNEKLAGYDVSELAVIRPWLQDFTATWLKKYKTYGGKEIKSQIQACYDNGVVQWLLWDPSNRYNGATNGGIFHQ